ncbi:MAG: proprotein convertase P-domain-containing protein, partial [Methylococcales bacterium]|nr:proprotein convertase P-domain-containing protein [Methylococcales bacterium]
SAARTANLLGASLATLTFDWRTSSVVDAGDSVVVEVSSDGLSFTKLEDFTNISGAASGSGSYDISVFTSSETTIRFRVNDLYNKKDKYFFVDNVQIAFDGRRETRTESPVWADQTINLLDGATLDENVADDGSPKASSPSLASPITTQSSSSCTTYTATDTPISLPNGASLISSSLSVNGSSNIVDVNVKVDMQHAWVGDLAFTLTHQNTGTAVTLIDRPGVPSSNYGCSRSNILATLDDDAGSQVENQCTNATPTIDGTFAPSSAFAAFNGENGDGTWILAVQDYYIWADAGVLSDWNIEICVAEDDSSSESPETIQDEFSQISYDNNDGTGDWASDWIEGSDDGSPNNGNVRITNNSLRMDNYSYIYGSNI